MISITVVGSMIATGTIVAVIIIITIMTIYLQVLPLLLLVPLHDIRLLIIPYPRPQLCADRNLSSSKCTLQVLVKQSP